jgi:hypothetical protein
MADMEDIKNGEEKSNKDFSGLESNTHDTFEKIKELLRTTTEKVIENLGYEKNNKVAGVYGDGTTYGTGVEENQYNVIITARPRKFSSSLNMSHGHGNGTFEKQIIIGTKRVESQLDFEIKGKILHIQYRSPEAGFFRGVDDEGKTFMVRKKISVPLKDADKVLKDELTDAAEREVGYLTNTKLGVEDRFEESTTSIVENLNMKKLTLKSLFEDDLDFSKGKINENEGFERLSDDEEENIPAVKKLNTLPLDGKDDVNLLFDDEEINFEEMIKEFGVEEAKEFKKRLEDEYGAKDGDVSDLTDAEKKDFFNSLKKETIEEITMSGPGGAGAGSYLTKWFAKNVSRKFANKSKGGKKSDVGAPYNIPVNHPIYEEGETLSESRKKSFEKTPYSKAQTSRPKVDKNWNIIPEERKVQASKPYTQVVKVDPNYHPQGMPFVEPNSKEELERTVGKDHDKMKRMGLNESEADRIERLRKRRFSSLTENEVKGINKRYIVTEKTSQEYEQERWKKLSTFSKFETIKEAEEMSSVLDNIDDYNSFFEEKVSLVNESKDYTLNESKKENTIEVEKPGSIFGIKQKFYEKDFLNESKKFILDLNSMVFVPNPNASK